MSEKDALGNFDFNKVTGSGLFLKFQAGQSITVRVLTTDPIVSTKTFTDKKTGEISVSTRFAFVVYNFTEGKAQLLQVGPGIAREFGKLHGDLDFGANIRKIDIKITPSGEGLERRYDIKVLQKAQVMTNDQIKEAQAINLDEKIEGGRMSEYDHEKARADALGGAGNSGSAVGSGGYESAKAQRDKLIERSNPDEQSIEQSPNEIFSNFDPNEPINLDDIPF